ncbi:MAG: hypothetical protein FWD57_03730 [Polyangiaceae bacterium]|nr:hypothetical protein [Polyangiaceae bacterium]
MPLCYADVAAPLHALGDDGSVFHTHLIPAYPLEPLADLLNISAFGGPPDAATWVSQAATPRSEVSPQGPLDAFLLDAFLRNAGL